MIEKTIHTFKPFWKACTIVAVVCFMSYGQAWAESPYPRDQVENHLRGMFPGLRLGSLPYPIPEIELSGFDFFVPKKRVRLTFFDLRDEEVEPVRLILKELFADILDKPVEGVNPYEQEFDLLVYVSDDLASDAMTPKYKSMLLGQDSEQEYASGLKDMTSSDVYFLEQRYLRKPGDPFAVIATERDDPRDTKNFSFEGQIRFTLFHALTGARLSDAIKPSAVNWPDTKQRLNGFAPIDRAVLRAIFGHEDWSGKDYETRIQLLTDRVMQQLPR